MYNRYCFCVSVRCRPQSEPRVVTSEWCWVVAGAGMAAGVFRPGWFPLHTAHQGSYTATTRLYPVPSQTVMAATGPELCLVAPQATTLSNMQQRLETAFSEIQWSDRCEFVIHICDVPEERSLGGRGGGGVVCMLLLLYVLCGEELNVLPTLSGWELSSLKVKRGKVVL